MRHERALRPPRATESARRVGEDASPPRDAAGLELEGRGERGAAEAVPLPPLAAPADGTRVRRQLQAVDGGEEGGRRVAEGGALRRSRRSTWASPWRRAGGSGARGAAASCRPGAIVRSSNVERVISRRTCDGVIGASGCSSEWHVWMTWAPRLSMSRLQLTSRSRGSSGHGRLYVWYDRVRLAPRERRHDALRREAVVPLLVELVGQEERHQVGDVLVDDGLVDGLELP